MEKDDELKGISNSIDFGNRIYDPRLGRWLSLDPLISEFPDISPYAFSGNSPILFIDYEGKTFGIRINHDDKTIVMVENVYTISKKSYDQAIKGVAKWNAKKAMVGGYSVSFEINVIKAPEITIEEAKKYNPDIVNKKGKINNAKLSATTMKLAKLHVQGTAGNDPIGNAYFGNFGGQNVSEERFQGGITEEQNQITMNTHTTHGDLGQKTDLVAHEFGHTFGLKDEKNRSTGVTNKYYSPGGIMEYVDGIQKPISDDDVSNILLFAKDKLNGIDLYPTSAKVTILSNIGASSGSNPIGVKGEEMKPLPINKSPLKL